MLAVAVVGEHGGSVVVVVVAVVVVGGGVDVAAAVVAAVVVPVCSNLCFSNEPQGLGNERRYKRGHDV